MQELAMSMKPSPSTQLMTYGAMFTITFLANKAKCQTTHLSEVSRVNKLLLNEAPM